MRLSIESDRLCRNEENGRVLCKLYMCEKSINDDSQAKTRLLIIAAIGLALLCVILIVLFFAWKLRLQRLILFLFTKSIF